MLHLLINLIDMKKLRKQNDELLKGAFEEWFTEFLRFLYPQADDLFDFSRGLTFMDKELYAIIPERERTKGKRVAVRQVPCSGGDYCRLHRRQKPAPAIGVLLSGYRYVHPFLLPRLPHL